MRSFRHKLEHFSVAAVPLHIPGARQMMPALALICIFFWDMTVPGLMPLLFLLALGLLEDTLSGAPLGVSSTVNIAFALILRREQRAFGRARFGAVWLGFILLSFTASILQWVILSFYAGRLLPLAAIILQWIATCIAYPPMHLLLSRIYRMLFAS